MASEKPNETPVEDSKVNERIKEIIDKSKVKSMMFYDVEHEKQRILFQKFTDTFNEYRAMAKHEFSKEPSTNDAKLCKESVLTLNKSLTSLIKDNPDRSVAILREFGIWALPPSEKVLQYMRRLVSDNKITTIIDYGTGVALWPSVINRYLRGNKEPMNIIAYDINDPLENKWTKKNNGFYPVVTQFSLKNVTGNQLLIMTWPTETEMAYNALTAFTGTFVILSGDVDCCGDKEFKDELSSQWRLDMKFKPIGNLVDSFGKISDVTYVYRRKNENQLRQAP